MKKLLLLGFTAVFAAACNNGNDDDNTPTPSNMAKVKYTNACISTGALRVQVNDVALQNVNSLTYLASSAYINVTPGTNVKHGFVIEDSNLPLASVNNDLVANNAYSVFATGTVTSPSAIAITDDLTAPPTGNAKIRFVNLSPDNLSESVYVGQTKLDSNVMFKQATPFRQVAAGSYQIIVQDPANVPSSRTLSGQQLDAGKIYTLMITGTVAGSGSAALTLTLVNNQ
ncbi:DUF4397 domain-containing protein [Polluticoccus soli]|uniref:DUF4397 domain-containing protein n=1 Tax=Polluticoccus soli TaxID=3034150 RepID=UPI0023E29567|nr:DUF4397 domain-containing protein [Flavipsychrobacter sp. JY13-12]